jgi:hypothetical protein
VTPRECIENAKAAEREAEKRLERACTLTVVFGGRDELAKRANDEYAEAKEAARMWREVAAMHPQTRARMLRNKELPVSMFGF